ncbi:hypothetical protein CEXT_449751 [Caerostris extrusa]|uniref:Uncharacterized protein n=1 Tax=Caerostris extrusa TaxID=172846 RepID=A0AAV4U879_CAEEX|nr:hypothetical protein CEXT_449751 [Caerostris extrusa]
MMTHTAHLFKPVICGCAPFPWGATENPRTLYYKFLSERRRLVGRKIEVDILVPELLPPSSSFTLGGPRRFSPGAPFSSRMPGRRLNIGKSVWVGWRIRDIGVQWVGGFKRDVSTGTYFSLNGLLEESIRVCFCLHSMLKSFFIDHQSGAYIFVQKDLGLYWRMLLNFL